MREHGIGVGSIHHGLDAPSGQVGFSNVSFLFGQELGNNDKSGSRNRVTGQLLRPAGEASEVKRTLAEPSRNHGHGATWFCRQQILP